MKISNVEQELRQHGKCVIQTVGVSMEPLLHHRYSTVVLQSVRRPLRRGDVVLFRRPAGGEYVLHRIVRVTADGFLIRGDNCLFAEAVTPLQILALMTGFWNGDRFTDCATDAAYRRYVAGLRGRFACKWLRAFPRRAAGKLKRVFYEIVDQ